MWPPSCKTSELTDRDYLDLCRMNCGMPPSRPSQEKTLRGLSSAYTYESLKQSEWSDRFERGMRDRLIVGAYRYGRLFAPFKPKYDRVGSIIRRAQKYAETGNQDFLFDIANEALLEYTEPFHPNAHMEAIDDGEIHTQVLA